MTCFFMLAAYLYVYRCLRHNDCSWSYSATGLEYQFLAGPAFTLIFTTCALPMGFIATFAFVPRKIVLSVLVDVFVEEETAGSKIFEDEIMVVHVVDMSTVTETEIGKRKLKKMKSIFVTLGSFIALH